MAFTDPLKVKFDASTETECPRVSSGSYESEYMSADGLKKVKIATSNGRRKRHSFRLDLSKITTDPFDTTQNVEVGTSAYLVVDRPLAGFTNEELRKLCEGLKTILTEANLNKFLASES
jgi:hypothetical protein